MQDYNDVIREAIGRVYGHACIAKLPKSGTSSQPSLPHTVNYNAQQALSILESDSAFFIVQPFTEHSLRHLLHFSPCAVFENSTTKPMFLLFQMLKLMSFCHANGLALGSLNPHDLAVDQNLWLSVSLPCVSSVQDACLGQDVLVIAGKQPVDEYRARDVSPRDLAPSASLSDLVLQWVNRQLSNFQYVMCLNYLAGRRYDSPNHHPILPWVMNFTDPNTGYRDLTRSKYRLNKGDDQLDITYETDPAIGSLYPHHISDFLSDITYYVYEARRTPKEVLCTHVRRKWVPHEYPNSMQRMYDWSPDECIPAFFNDPGIFKSIHEDLPDLELPSWSSSPEDFVSKHMACLESDHVSQHINDWIDLTFGYKVIISRRFSH